MVSPFALVLLNGGAFKVLWEDLLLGFGIATFALCRLLSRRHTEVVIADWVITILSVLTLINPFLFSYFKINVAIWNNYVIGSLVLLLAIYQDWQDAGTAPWGQHHRKAH